MDVKTSKHSGLFRQEKSEYIAFENENIMVYIPKSMTVEHVNEFWGPRTAPNYYSLDIVFMVYSEKNQAIDLSQLIEFKTENGVPLDRYTFPDKHDWQNEIIIPAKQWTGIFASLALYNSNNYITDFDPEKEKFILVPIGYVNGKFNIYVSRTKI